MNAASSLRSHKNQQLLVCGVLFFLITVFAFFVAESFSVITSKLLLAAKTYEVPMLLLAILYGVNVMRQRDQQYIADGYLYWVSWIRNPRMAFIALSLALGLTPVKGRSLVAVPYINSTGKRISLGDRDSAIVNYASTHTYYLISPIEPALMFVVATVGLSYIHFVGWLLPAILFMVGVVIWHSMKSKPGTSVPILSQPITFGQAFKVVMPTLALLAILFVGAFTTVPYTMAIGAVVFVAITHTAFRPDKAEAKKSFLGIDPIMLIMLLLILTLSVFTKQLPWIVELTNHLLASNANVIALLGVAYLCGLTIGSSNTMVSVLFPLLVPILQDHPEKYALCAMIFGAEYAGYIASPAHACCHYVASGFNVSYIQVWRRIALYGIGAFAFICLGVWLLH